MKTQRRGRFFSTRARPNPRVRQKRISAAVPSRRTGRGFVRLLAADAKSPRGRRLMRSRRAATLVGAFGRAPPRSLFERTPSPRARAFRGCIARTRRSPRRAGAVGGARAARRRARFSSSRSSSSGCARRADRGFPLARRARGMPTTTPRRRGTRVPRRTPRPGRVVRARAPRSFSSATRSCSVRSSPGAGALGSRRSTREPRTSSSGATPGTTRVGFETS